MQSQTENHVTAIPFHPPQPVTTPPLLSEEGLGERMKACLSPACNRIPPPGSTASLDLSLAARSPPHRP